MNTSMTQQFRSGFTLIELIAVLAVLVIVSTVAVPRYFDDVARARLAVLDETLGQIRRDIASYHEASASTGSAVFPTLDQLRTAGVVVQTEFPPNPYNGDSSIKESIWRDDRPIADGTTGWNYDPLTGRFWANSNSRGVAEYRR